jgi:exonuclease SbcD
VRAFKTIKVDVSEAENPQEQILKAVGKQEIEDAVVRLIYQLRSHQIDLIDNTVIHAALSAAHNYTIQAELVSQLARPRVPELNAGAGIDPLSALQTYLDNREGLEDIKTDLLEAAEGLLAGDEQMWQFSSTGEDGEQREADNPSVQLKLL